MAQIQPNYGKTERLTVGQAVVRYIAAQYTISDGVKRRFIPAAFGIFGHGNVAGLGQALDQYNDILPLFKDVTSKDLHMLQSLLQKLPIANKRWLLLHQSDPAH